MFNRKIIYPDACGNPATVPWQRDVCKETTNKKKRQSRQFWILFNFCFIIILVLLILNIIFIPLWLPFGTFLASFYVLFLSFWGFLAPFWHPWAPFGRPWGPSRKNDTSGANWGRIPGPNRAPLWVQFSYFFWKNWFWAVFFDHTFSESFFYRFLAALG